METLENVIREKRSSRISLRSRPASKLLKSMARNGKLAISLSSVVIVNVKNPIENPVSH